MKAKRDEQIITAHNLQKDKILQALTTSKDISEASKIAGVTRKTIYSYLKDDDFIIAYRDIKRVQLRDITEKIAIGANKATDFIFKILEDEAAPNSIKLQAGIKVLEMYMKFVEIDTNLNEASFKDNESIFDIMPNPSGL